jgi:hypothetical protein
LRIGDPMSSDSLILHAEAEHLHIVLLPLTLALMLGGNPAFFGFYIFSFCLQTDSLLLYLEFCHALSMFRHLAMMFIRSDVGENFGLRFGFIREGLLTRPLSLVFLRGRGAGQGG